MNEEIKEILELFKEYANGGMSGLYPPEDLMKEFLNYITNLRNENEELKNQLDFIEEQNKYIDRLERMVKDYGKRIKRAIEYINENWGHWCSDHCKYATETIDILRGIDDK